MQFLHGIGFIERTFSNVILRGTPHKLTPGQYTVRLLLPEITGLTFQDDLASINDYLPSIPVVMLPGADVAEGPLRQSSIAFSNAVYDEPIPWPSIFNGVDQGLSMNYGALGSSSQF
jgi:hypothetical protein